MKNLKKIITFFLVILFSFQLSFEVLAQKKSKNTKTKLRSGSSKSARARSGSSKSTRARSGSARSSGVKRASSKRSAGLTKGSAVGSSSETTSTVSDAENNCANSYAVCMDLQIPNIVSKFAYLSDDVGLEALSESGEPLRCVYYHNLEGSSDSFNNKKDINGLYFAYNYYCSTVEEVGESGQPVMKCEFNTNSGNSKMFATKNSYAFYKETFDRLQAGELKIVNFDKSSLYQKYIKDMNLDKVITIEPADVSDLFKGMGLETGVASEGSTDLFSVSVAPPVGAGSLVPATVYQKAHDICVGELKVPSAKDLGLTSAQLDELKVARNKVKGSSCVDQIDAIKDYYINGISIETSEESSYYSAKKSCLAYESALLSVRNDVYAKFLDNMTNYLSDNIAKLVSKEAKSSSTIASAFNTLKIQNQENKLAELETQNEMKVMEIEMAAKMDKMEREAEAEKKRLDAEMKILEAETSKQLAEAKKQEVEAKKEATKVELEAKKEEVEAKQKMESFEKSSEITKQTTVNNTFKDSGSINLGSGCYAVTLLGAGGGGGTSKFMSWGSKGGHGGKYEATVCVKSGTAKLSYTVGKGGKSDTKGEDTSFIVTGDAVMESGAELGTKYIAYGGNGGCNGCEGWSDKGRADSGKCSAGPGTCTQGGGASGGGLTVFESGGTGGNGSVTIKSI